MNREKYIYICTEQATGKQWFYSSIKAMGIDDNPIRRTARTIHKRVKENGGFPVDLNGCLLDKDVLKSTTDVARSKLVQSPPLIGKVVS